VTIPGMHAGNLAAHADGSRDLFNSIMTVPGHPSPRPPFVRFDLVRELADR
jgi:hypothetical protein